MSIPQKHVENSKNQLTTLVTASIQPQLVRSEIPQTNPTNSLREQFEKAQPSVVLRDISTSTNPQTDKN